MHTKIDYLQIKIDAILKLIHSCSPLATAYLQIIKMKFSIKVKHKFIVGGIMQIGLPVTLVMQIDVILPHADRSLLRFTMRV